MYNVVKGGDFMFSSIWFDWINSTREEKIIIISFFAIMLGIGIIDYLYRKHKENKKKWQKLIFLFF